jgi:hypothetical protein
VAEASWNRRAAIILDVTLAELGSSSEGLVPYGFLISKSYGSPDYEGWFDARYHCTCRAGHGPFAGRLRPQKPSGVREAIALGAWATSDKGEGGETGPAA